MTVGKSENETGLDLLKGITPLRNTVTFLLLFIFNFSPSFFLSILPLSFLSFIFSSLNKKE